MAYLSPHPCQHLLCLAFSIRAILSLRFWCTFCWWLVILSIFHMSPNVFCPFFSQAFCFWLLSFWSSLYVLCLNPLLDVWSTNISPIFFFFTLLIIFFCFAEAFWFDVVLSVHIYLCCPCFCSHIQKKTLPNSMSRNFLPMFSPRSFTVSGLMFKSLIHFELILCMVYNMGPVSFFFIWISSFSSIICCMVFPHYVQLASLWKISW